MGLSTRKTKKKVLKYRGYQIIWIGEWGGGWYADIPGTMFRAKYGDSLRDVKKKIDAEK